VTDLGAKLELYGDHPAIMAREMFDIEPDIWQEKVLESFPHEPRMAMQACTGPGKTLTLALLGWNFMITRPFPNIGVTSINADNLKSGLWKELARLYDKSTYLKKKFAFSGKRIVSREFPNTWYMESRTWARNANAEQIGAALKGLHAAYVMWLLDETGAYPVEVLPAVEGIFSGSPIEAHIVQAGNPISRAALLFRCTQTNRRDWFVVEITADPLRADRTPRVSVAHAEQQIRSNYGGRDNPWVRMNILGLFPHADVNALIGEDEVEESMRRVYGDFHLGDSPRIIGVDVAREGDDKSAICKRRGLQVYKLLTHSNIDGTQGAGIVAREERDFDSDATFVDGTGGWGWSWIDNLVRLGRSPIAVPFSGAASQPERYANKRAEMYFETVAWIRRGGALPQSFELKRGLCEVTYGFQGDRLLLEPKESLKSRLGFSPDETDSVVLTHAAPVTRKQSFALAGGANAAKEYDPFREINNRG
jgi:hypothetical protein